MSNKNRVFVAIYAHPLTDQTSQTSSRSKAKAGDFHWGIWIEPKNSKGEGMSYALEDNVAYSSVTNPFGWRFRNDSHTSLPPRMLGRIMIGKVPEDVSESDVTSIFKEVPLPSDPGSKITDSADWTKCAIEMLQNAGCSESFSVDAFMDEALGHAKGWAGKGGRVEKVNYTWSRTFP